MVILNWIDKRFGFLSKTCLLSDNLDKNDFMKSDRQHFLLLFLFLTLAGLALNPDLFVEGIRQGERAYQNLPDRVYNMECLKQGRLPLWNPYHFFGNAHIALHQTGFFYPLNILLYGILNPLTAIKIMTFLDTLLAGVFMALYLRRLGTSFTAAAAGGLTLMTCGYMISHEGHTANHNSICWIPLLFFFIEGFLEKHDRRNFAGGVVTLAVLIFAGYMHTVVLTVFMILVYCMMFLILGRRDLRLRIALVLGVGAMITWGGILSSVQILTTLVFSPSPRGPASLMSTSARTFSPSVTGPYFFSPCFCVLDRRILCIA